MLPFVHVFGGFLNCRCSRVRQSRLLRHLHRREAAVFHFDRTRTVVAPRGVADTFAAGNTDRDQPHVRLHASLAGYVHKLWFACVWN